MGWPVTVQLVNRKTHWSLPRKHLGVPPVKPSGRHASAGHVELSATAVRRTAVVYNRLRQTKLRHVRPVTKDYTPSMSSGCYLRKIASGATAGIALAKSPDAMPMLEFVDSTGVTWRVWNTVPSSRTTLSGEFERGWLTFESPASLKRLAPVPPNWETAPVDRLELMCRAAEEVSRRTGTGEQEARADPTST